MGVLVLIRGLYLQLGRTGKTRQSAYRALFRSHISKAMLEEIRASTNKGWALGSDRFRDEVALLSGRRAKPLPKGRPKKKDN